jgi:central kinetochore subunit Mal2/MCM21
VLKSRIEKTTRDNQTAAHRLTMGATLFTTRDPDPYAVDEGAVTGIRFESYDSATRTFTTPSYVFLNKPWRVVQPDRNDEDDRDTRFRIHRHTLPPSVHLEALAEKYLPAPADSSSAKQTKKQDLQGFVRALRKELVSLRKRQQITKKSSENTWRLEAVNAEATDMRVTWSSGEVGRLRIDKDGSIEECFVDAEEGTRRRYLERKIKHIDSVQHLTAALEDRTT